MHIEARLFEFLTAFFALCTVLYGTLTALYAYGGIEWAGTTALVLTTGLTLITGTFFRFVARRLDTRPELLFILRGADHMELITQAAQVDSLAAAPSKKRRIAAANLEEVFGVELEPASPPITLITPITPITPSTKKAPAAKLPRSASKKRRPASTAASKSPI